MQGVWHTSHEQQWYASGIINMHVIVVPSEVSTISYAWLQAAIVGAWLWGVVRVSHLQRRWLSQRRSVAGARAFRFGSRAAMLLLLTGTADRALSSFVYWRWRVILAGLLDVASVGLTGPQAIACADALIRVASGLPEQCTAPRCRPSLTLTWLPRSKVGPPWGGSDSKGRGTVRACTVAGGCLRPLPVRNLRWGAGLG